MTKEEYEHEIDVAMAWIKRLLAAQAWQPIETAPIKSRQISEPMILFCPGITSWNRHHMMPPIVVGIWTGGNWESDVGDVDQGYESTGAYFVREVLRPTHWMPLPESPK